MSEVHAENYNGDDRTLCGTILEGFEGDGREVILLAAPGRVVTCPMCKLAIAHCQDVYTGNYRRRGVTANDGDSEHG